MSKKSVFDWCLKQGERTENHKGVREIAPNKENSQRHMDKALHNVKAFDHNIEEFPDWSVSAAFYAMYHSLLAVLAQLGYESRNQECTINTVDYFIETKKIELDRKYIEMIRRTSEMLPRDAKLLREEFQYGTNVSVNKEILNNLRKNTIEFTESVQICLEKMRPGS